MAQVGQQPLNMPQVSVQIAWNRIRTIVREMLVLDFHVRMLIADHERMADRIAGYQQDLAGVMAALAPLELIVEDNLTITQFLNRNNRRQQRDNLIQLILTDEQALLAIQNEFVAMRVRRNQREVFARNLLAGFSYFNRWVVLKDFADFVMVSILRNMHRPLRFVIGRSVRNQKLDSMERLSADVGIPFLNWRRLMNMDINGLYQELTLQECLDVGFETY